MKSMRIIGVIAAAAAAMLLASCSTGNATTGASQASDKKVVITYWDGNAIPARTTIWKKIISDFEAANPNITINYVALPQDSSEQKLDTAIATHSEPDVAFLPSGDVPSFYAQGALAPLDKYLKASPLADQLNPSMVKAVRSYTPDGKLYALPSHNIPDILWYRPTLFKAAGLSAPKTYADLYADANKLTDAQKGDFGFTMRGGVGSTKQLGVDLYTASGVQTFFDKSGKTTLNDAANVAALTKFAALYGKDTPQADVTNSYTDMQAEFEGGKIAMMHHSIGSYPVLNQVFTDSEVKAIPFPKAKAGSPNMAVTASLIPSMGIFNGSKNKDAAWKFLEFVMSPKQNSQIAQQAGGVPGNSKVDVDAWKPAQPAVKVALDLLNDPKTVTVTFPLYLPELNSISTTMEPEFQKVLLNKETPKAFLDKWAGLINAAQAKYVAREKK